MKIKILIAALLSFVLTLFATDMIIHFNDGHSESIPINDIDAITFTETHPNPSRVLFIGNSYTYFNGGIDSHLMEFVSSSDIELEFLAEAETAGGASLQYHWNHPETQNLIANGSWDYVILQEQSLRPIEEPQLFYQYADSLTNLIHASGAQPAFFMTWARAFNPAMIEDLAAAYNSAGEQFDAMVCPVGRAFQISLENNPLIILHSNDESHPNTRGTYLAVCTFFASLFQQSPVGVNYINDDTISEFEQNYLQQSAWQAYLSYPPLLTE